MFQVSSRLIDKIHARESRALQSGQRARQLNLETPLELETEMVGILWTDFRKLSRIPSHEQAVAQKLLVDFAPATMEAVFVSHDWWVRTPDGAAEPDYPDGHAQAHLKHDVLCAGIMALMRNGALDVGKQTLVWLDAFSIDTLDAERRESAVASLPHYVSMCKVMLIPTQLEHIEATLPAQLEPFSTRCWCQCECFLFALLGDLIEHAAGSTPEGESGGLHLYAASVSGELTRFARVGGGAHPSLPSGLPSGGALSVEADRALIDALQAKVADAHGRARVRGACHAARKGPAAGVELSGALLSDEHVAALASRIAAGDLDQARHIELSHNGALTDAAVEALGAALKAHPLPKLEGVSFEGCGRVSAAASLQPYFSVA